MPVSKTSEVLFKTMFKVMQDMANKEEKAGGGKYIILSGRSGALGSVL